MRYIYITSLLTIFLVSCSKNEDGGSNYRSSFLEIQRITTDIEYIYKYGTSHGLKVGDIIKSDGKYDYKITSESHLGYRFDPIVPNGVNGIINSYLYIIEEANITDGSKLISEERETYEIIFKNTPVTIYFVEKSYSISNKPCYRVKKHSQYAVYEIGYGINSGAPTQTNTFVCQNDRYIHDFFKETEESTVEKFRETSIQTGSISLDNSIIVDDLIEYFIEEIINI